MGRASYSGRVRSRAGRFAPLMATAAVCAIAVALAATMLLGRRARQPAESPPVTTPAVGDGHAHPAISPTSLDAALEAADAYMRSGELPKAEAIAARLVERAPEDARAHELLGTILARKASEADAAGRVDDAAASRREAYEHYRFAARLTPGIAGLEHSSGLMATAAGETKAALAHFELAARLDPVNPQYPLFGAQVLIQLGALEEAETAIDRTLLLDPDEPSAHASRAVIAIERDRLDDALAHVSIARGIAPRDIRFRVLESRIHRRRGEPLRALELLVVLSPMERADDAVAFELATSHADLGNHAAAAEAWAHRFAHGARDGRRYLAAVGAGDARLRAGERVAAARWLDSAMALAPNAPEVEALQRRIDVADDR